MNLYKFLKQQLKFAIYNRFGLIVIKSIFLRNDIYAQVTGTLWDAKSEILRACIDFSLAKDNRLLTESRSQSFQELVAVTILGKLPQRIVIEAGAYDGVTYSNTYVIGRYSKQQTLLIEPNPLQFSLLVKNRTEKNVECLNLALSSVNGTGTLNTVADEPLFAAIPMAHAYDGNSKKRKEKAVFVEVRLRVLREVIQERSIDGSFDLLFLDVEGHEVEVLEGLGDCSFKVGIIEVNNKLHRSNVCRLLFNKDYHVFDYPFSRNEVLAIESKTFQRSELKYCLEKFRIQSPY
jgi:FkbM family methyltransferase